MKKKKLSKWFLLVIIVGSILGSFIGMYIGLGDDWRVDYIAPGLGGALIGFTAIFLFAKWREFKRGNVPEYDERTLLLLKRYFLIVLYVLLIGSGTVFLTLMAFGIKTVETGWLIVGLMVIYLIVGFGAVVVKRV